jgi:hypothetical protein
MKPLLSLPLSLIALLAASHAHAQFTATYDFDGVVADVTGTQASEVTAGNFVGFSDAKFSSGTESGYMFTEHTGTDEAAALADDDYFAFTISAANGGEFLNLSSFTFDFGGRGTASYTTNIVVQSSVGGFGSGNPILDVSTSSLTTTGTNANELTNTIVDVSGVEFNSLSTVTFQIRYFDDSDSGSVMTNRLDNVVVSGAVIPEPASAAMIAGLLGLAFVMVRRR